MRWKSATLASSGCPTVRCWHGMVLRTSTITGLACPHRRTAHTDGKLHSGVHRAAPPHAIGNVLCRGKKAGGAVSQDRRRVTADAERDGQLVRQAGGAGRRAYVLVNNRAEGNAPLTVEALVGM